MRRIKHSVNLGGFDLAYEEIGKISKRQLRLRQKALRSAEPQFNLFVPKMRYAPAKIYQTIREKLL